MTGSIASAVGRAIQVAKASARLKATRDRVFEIDLQPTPGRATIVLDGQDISRLLFGITIDASVNSTPLIRLTPAAGQTARLVAHLPDSQIVIARNVSRARLRMLVAEILTAEAMTRDKYAPLDIADRLFEELTSLKD